ncbi:alanine--tRNA ligase, mitochondrial isoform X2 [Copidosoma floridanum]|uniref:alanine--tRNA ligase, mitochondrial isoform X2 n=1 Tax=Copidosoma floridanum TaxID=29053 RepID=UPI000C6FA321|nr:alanine--tRNA ligase, mitochondrial isoform X2 [Copidosoma floridanum]
MYLCAQQLKLIRSSKSIRREFIEYFTRNNHALIRSSPVMPLNDPSIPFVNAGMNQFKGIFLGLHSPPAIRAVNSQKCIRVGGKHNDLNVVGHDSYHHTFFEMLGNWSFGDYFKEDACKYAWELLVQVYGIKKDCLYVTYFGGNEKFGLKPDLECKNIWLKIGVAEDRILPFGMEENFWEMGPSGPCGPCTEIHIDHTMHAKNQASRVNKGHEDLTELWNIVFIQFQRLQNGQIIPLPTKHVDTGLGFERLVTVLQGKRSNYDTDLFQPLFKAIEKAANAPKYEGRFGTADKDKIDTGYRILSDHARMITVSLADGMLPDKNHKLRRILRKAIDISENTFKTNKLLPELTDCIAETLGEAYPEIPKNLSKIKFIIQFEEEVMKSARSTAFKSWKKIVNSRPELSVITDTTFPGLTAGYFELQRDKVKSLPGDFTYKLYDTYGLDSEIISKLAEVESIQFDARAFKEAIERAKKRSRLEANKVNEDFVSIDTLNQLESGNVPKTDDSYKYEYTYSDKGYNFPIVKCKLLGMIRNGNLVSEPESMLNIDESQAIVEATVTSSGNIVETDSVVNTNAEVGIILDKTPAYAVAGSQVADKGHIQINNLLFNFEKVLKVRDYVIHIGHFVDWDEEDPDHEVRVGDECLISIDEKHRTGTMRNHTAAHLLNAAVQKLLPVVGQRGSDVLKDHLRFECSVFGRKLSVQDVSTIEKSVNDVIEADVPVKTKTLNILEMFKEDNLTLIPGEVYPDTGIRVVEINSDILNSKEACCGTHIHKTSVLEHFCITSMKSQGYNGVSFKAVVGPVAHLTRLAGDNLRERITNIENEFTAEQTSLGELESKVIMEKRDLNNKRKRIQYPYIVTQESLERLETLSKNIRIKEKKRTRHTIEEEIKILLDSSSLPFIVNCLQPTNTSIENISLKNIIKLCPPSTPTLVIVHCKNKIKARCFVPHELQSSSFNAQMWMNEILKIFDAKGNVFKDENPLVSYNMVPTVINEESAKILLDKAIATATKFASIYVDQSKKNKPNK